MFDLTKEIKLTPRLQKKYDVARIALHIAFVFSAGFVAFRILFPMVPLDFDMNDPNALKNTLVSPRIEQTKEFPSKGILKTGENILFNANPIGQFSSAKISFTLAKNGGNIENSVVKIQKSYRAFFFPTGQPIGFKDGSLLTTADGEYFMISNGTLRKFANTKIILDLGYPKDAFIVVSSDDLKYNNVGNDISDSSSYPDNTLFAIGDSYFELKNGQLSPFVSARAFLSQFDPANAIAKSGDFISKYKTTENYSAFADGTLGSSNNSVFILSETKAYPFETAETFTAMGFDWNTVTPLTQDELSAYNKQKQFTHDMPHPNGVIFVDQETNEHFMIKDGFKRPIKSEAVVKTYFQKPIVADSQSLIDSSSCSLKKNLLSSTKFECSADLKDLEALIGNDYQISTTIKSDASLNIISTTFSTPLSLTSMKNSLSKIKERIIAR